MGQFRSPAACLSVCLPQPSVKAVCLLIATEQSKAHQCYFLILCAEATP